uniref:Outer dense fiber protein 3 n=1 Tax=Heliothis virescens TaxID=7102 RepID=A0A2A4JBN4_HELVI
MPFGYACRTRILKQVPQNPTVRTAPISQEQGTPGPNHYDTPQISGGKGYSKIRRAPAYTFGRVLKPCCPSAISPNAPMFNVRGISEKGGESIPGGTMAPLTEIPGDKLKVPGPGTHSPNMALQVKRPPSYSMRPAAKPPYQAFDSWTPPPNMYCPPIPKPSAPSYTFSGKAVTFPPSKTPGPGEHNPKHDFVLRTKPAFSLGPGYRPIREIEDTPAPNVYCEKKYMLTKPSVPAPSFGIKHSPFLGKTEGHLKPADLELRIRQNY